MTDLNFNMDAQRRFLMNLLAIHSPTGYHREAMDFCHAQFEALNVPNLTVSRTNKGAVLLHWTGDASDEPRGVTAHADTLGLMVTEIKSNGRLKCTKLGGLTLSGAEYENVTVRTHTDQRYRGTFIHVNPSSHVNRQIEGERTLDNMEVRLDERVESAFDVLELGIAVGDFVFLDPRVEYIESSGYLRSRFLDDKAGVANIYGAIMALHDAGLRPAQDTTFLIANYEEVGHGGSAGMPDDIVELLTIDMGAIGQGQNGVETAVSICVKDGGGPYHFDMNSKLRDLATEHGIDFRLDIYVYYSSDGTAYWRAGGDACVGLIGPGVASSHGYERTHIDGLKHTTHLIARYLLS